MSSYEKMEYLLPHLTLKKGGGGSDFNVHIDVKRSNLSIDVTP